MEATGTLGGGVLRFEVFVVSCRGKFGICRSLEQGLSVVICWKSVINRLRESSCASPTGFRVEGKFGVLSASDKFCPAIMTRSVWEGIELGLCTSHPNRALQTTRVGWKEQKMLLEFQGVLWGCDYSRNPEKNGMGVELWMNLALSKVV